jgi:hypothetical protein
VSAFKEEVGKVSEFKEKMKQGGLWQGVKKSKFRQIGQFFKGGILSRRKTRGCSRSLVSVYGRRQRRLPCGFSQFLVPKIHRG